MQPLLIRADANPSMGTGHVMRCLALAQAWQDAGGRVSFLTCDLPPLLEQRLTAEGVTLARSAAEPSSADDASQLVASARAAGADWVVVDGYQFGASYQRLLKEAGLKVLFVDDYGHAPPYCVDLVLNQNLGAEESLYRERETPTQLLLGTSYALLRREFAPWGDWKRDVPQCAAKLLVTMGGGDAPSTTGKVLEALRSADLSDLEVCLVVGPANPRRATLEAEAAATGQRIRIVSADRDMPELMAWADVAVASAGITCWELLFLGLPSLLVIQSQNQQRLAEAVHGKGAARNLGWADRLLMGDIAQALSSLVSSQPLRLQMSQRARGLVDGLGAARVLHAMGVELFRFRPVSDGDCEMLWKWANDPQVRAVAFSPDFIRWEEHVSWFRGKLANPRCIFYIASDSAGAPVGQVRYDVEGNEEEATISVSLEAKFRGAGLGSRVVSQASRKLFQERKVRTIHAYVKPGNEASVRAFASAGYLQADATTVRGHNALHFILRKGSD